MNTRKTSYDSRCYDLAEVFIEGNLIGSDHEDRIDELAQLIQRTIEDWLEANPPKV